MSSHAYKVKTNDVVHKQPEINPGIKHCVRCKGSPFPKIANNKRLIVAINATPDANEGK